MAATKTARDKRRCDDYVRDIVRSRGFCERCKAESGPHEHAHIIRRRYSFTRTDERNGWCLCHDCHTTVDTNIIEFNKLVEATIGWTLFAELNAQKNSGGAKFDWSSELVRLKARWNEIQEEAA